MAAVGQIVTTRGVPAHLTRASVGVRAVVVVFSFLIVLLPWHQAAGQAPCSGLSHYGSALPILSMVGLAATGFARITVGGARPWSVSPIGLASGVVSAAAAAGALALTASTAHPGSSSVVAIGKAAEMFRAFQWVIVAMGMWQVYLHGAAAMRGSGTPAGD